MTRRVYEPLHSFRIDAGLPPPSECVLVAAAPPGETGRTPSMVMRATSNVSSLRHSSGPRASMHVKWTPSLTRSRAPHALPRRVASESLPSRFRVTSSCVSIVGWSPEILGRRVSRQTAGRPFAQTLRDHAPADLICPASFLFSHITPAA
jgi:hypothetical protein